MLWKPALPSADLAGLRAHLAVRPRVLAHGRTAAGFLIAAPGRLAWGSGGDWDSVGWHEVATGGWDGESNTLRLRTVTGESKEFVLNEVGRLPEAFRERVSASLVLEHHERGPGNVDLLFTARRSLSEPSAPLVWDASATDGRTLDRPGLKEFTQAVLARLKDDLEGAS